MAATVTDPLGRTSETDEYTAAPVLHTPADTFTGTWYLTGGTTTATAYGYDGHGNQAVVTDAGGHTWTTTYNLLGQATAKADPDAGTTTGMTYDGDGNLLQQTSADGKTVSFTYDQLSRKTAEYAAASGSQSPSNEMASWVYDNSNNAVPGMKDAVGHLTTETSYSGGQAYTIQQAGFNVFGESLGERVTIPATAATAGLSGSYSFGHTYTAGTGLPFDDKYPAAGGLPAETTGHTYLGSPLPLPSGLGGTIDGYAQHTSYDAYGDVTQEEIGTGADLAYITSTYDPHTLKLTSQHVSRTAAPADVDEEDYTYDLDGNPTSQTSTRLGSAAQSETQCFTYDTLDRLTAAWTATDNCAATPAPSSHSTVGDGLGPASAYWTTWSYDVLGDMTSSDQHALSGGADTITTDTFGGTAGGPHALTTAAASGGTVSTSTFGYDPAGNMTSRDTPANGSQSLTWTADGKLASVAGPGGTTAYVYDADGNLLLQENPGSTTLYLPGEQLTAVTSGGTVTVTGARIIPLPSGGDVVRTGATTSYSFEIPDTRGTSTLYLDHTAQVPAWRQFTPYGAPRGTPVTWIDNRAFLGKPADPATGLDYLGARAYDPVTGQFTSPDPIYAPANPQSLDPYDYAADNPETLSDPSGKDPIASQIVSYLATHPSKADNAALAAVYAPPPQYHIPLPAFHFAGGGNTGGSSPHLPKNPCVQHPTTCLPFNNQFNTIDWSQKPGNNGNWRISTNVCAAFTIGFAVGTTCGTSLAAASGESSGQQGQGKGGARQEVIDFLTKLVSLAASGDEEAAATLERLKQIREVYKNGFANMTRAMREMEASGASEVDIARTVNAMRNDVRVQTWQYMEPKEVDMLIESNMKAYQNPYGMTAAQAYAKYGSWQGVIDAAFRSNATIDAILGLGG